MPSDQSDNLEPEFEHEFNDGSSEDMNLTAQQWATTHSVHNYVAKTTRQ